LLLSFLTQNPKLNTIYFFLSPLAPNQDFTSFYLLINTSKDRPFHFFQVTLKRSNNSTVWFEYIWEEEGHHRRRSAVFSFKVTFNSF
jgi:hypothetical protein